MADKIAIKQLQGLEQISPFVTLFELEYDDAGTKKYFVRGGEEARRQAVARRDRGCHLGGRR